ncbi:hypothetical protein M0802_013310 [Mischocyttarus mexicanus]|nr:hypothetical protein M0802_013310 [Mischocyttarus mexicanus]
MTYYQTKKKSLTLGFVLLLPTTTTTTNIIKMFDDNHVLGLNKIFLSVSPLGGDGSGGGDDGGGGGGTGIGALLISQ